MVSETSSYFGQYGKIIDKAKWLGAWRVEWPDGARYSYPEHDLLYIGDNEPSETKLDVCVAVTLEDGNALRKRIGELDESARKWRSRAIKAEQELFELKRLNVKLKDRMTAAIRTLRG